MSKTEVIKASWVVHISHDLSLIQQQLWNALLANAYDNLAVKTIHEIDLRILLFHVGKNRSISYLQTILSQLCTIESYNLIDKTGWPKFSDQKVTKNKFRLLTTAIIEDGLCKYSFSTDLIPQMVNPPAYAKINLLTQRAFKSKYSLIVYELCVDYLHIERTPRFTIEQLKTYLGIEQTEYKEFKHFNYKIIKKVISEVNQKSDLSIAVKFECKNGIDYLWFTIHKKTRTEIDMAKMAYKAARKIPMRDMQSCPFTQLKEYGVSDKKAHEIIQLFSTQDVQKALHELQRNFEKIANPSAWLASIFNKQKDPHQKIMDVRTINSFDYEKEKRIEEHRNYINNRVKEIWESMPHERKQSINVAYEQWIIKQDFKFNFIGSRSLFFPIFLEEVLLENHEKNFDTWNNN